MNGYLVVLRCFNDDLPILLTDDKERAQEIAKQIEPDCRAVKAVEEVLSLDASEESNVSIWTFKDGAIVAAEVVKEFA